MSENAMKKFVTIKERPIVLVRDETRYTYDVVHSDHRWHRLNDSQLYCRKCGVIRLVDPSEGLTRDELVVDKFDELNPDDMNEVIQSANEAINGAIPNPRHNTQPETEP